MIKSPDFIINISEPSLDPNTQELLRIREKAERDYCDAITRNRREGKEEGRAEGRAEGIEIGEARGIEIGEHQKAVEMAKNCLIDGLAPEKVAKFTGLSIEEVKKLKK